MARNLQAVEGIVEAMNERGVKIGETWYNYSRYAEQIAPHEVGDKVKLGVDGQGFVRMLEVLERAPKNGAGNRPASPQREYLSAEQYVRLQVLPTALQAVLAHTQPEKGAALGDTLRLTLKFAQALADFVLTGAKGNGEKS